MEELDVLKRRVKNASELMSLVKVMKAISSANVREYGRAIETLQEYNRTIELGLQVAMMQSGRRSPPIRAARGKARLGAVIFGSDQGLIGKFNEQVALYAVEKMNEIEHEERVALAVGARVVDRLEASGLKVDSHFSFSGSLAGITQVMLDVLLKVEDWREKSTDQIVLFYNRQASGASFSPHMAYLYPLDGQWLGKITERKWPCRTIPTCSMDREQIFSSLVREYIFFSLYRAFVESLVSENSSRLLSMQMAEKNIEEHLGELTVQLHRQRQDAITSELLDVVTGFEALE